MKKNRTFGRQDGALSVATTGTRQGTQSTNGGNPSTSAMSGTTQGQKQIFQATPTLTKDIPEKVQTARLMIAFASQLRKLGLVSPRKISLPSGERGWAIFMPEELWKIDEQSKELLPR